MNDQIVQHPWEQNPPQSPLSTNNLMDATQLDALFQMAFFFPFNTIDDQGQLAHDANILSSTRQVNIAVHALEVLWGEMGII